MKNRLLQLKGNMTLREFAGKCDMLQSTMFNYLKGRDMNVKALVKVSKHFGVSIDWLVTGRGKQFDEFAKLNGMQGTLDCIATELRTVHNELSLLKLDSIKGGVK